MIKLITLFFILITANAQTTAYLLPDKMSLFEHHLMSHLKKANHKITILTPSFHYPALRTQLMHTVQKGIKLTLIAQNPAADMLRLIAYQGVDLYTYQSRHLADTVIVIDDTLVCHLPGGLHDEDLTRKTQSVLCSNEPDLIQPIQENMFRILSRSKPYLK